jgi:dimethylargininase
MPIVALTRAVPDAIARCELTHLVRVPIDVDEARAQHAEYERALMALGCTIEHIAPAPELPDAVFVEDTAIVLDEVAVMTRPGAESRRPEVASAADALAPHRELLAISAPATLDGGDVLRLGRVLYVGVGARTNRYGAAQLADLVRPHGYLVRPVAIDACLHLKSAVTEAAPGVVLLNPSWVSCDHFADHDAIEVDPDEPFAANVLRIGETVLCAAAHGRTAARLARAGLTVLTVNVSELAKAEAGLTCCSLIVAVPPAR